MNTEWIEWIYYADDDIVSAEDLVRIHSSTGHVAVCCQQAIEKYFKSHLLKNGWELRKTHDLVELYREIVGIQSWNLDEGALATLADVNGVYIDDRYPGDVGRTPDGLMPTEEKAQLYLELAQEVETAFKKLHINSVDDIKKIIECNYGFALDSEKVTSLTDAINGGKMEPYQAYNMVIEEIRDARRKARTAQKPDSPAA